MSLSLFLLTLKYQYKKNSTTQNNKTKIFTCDQLHCPTCILKVTTFQLDFMSIESIKRKKKYIAIMHINERVQTS